MKPARLVEIKALIVIALPLIFAYLADVAMIITAKMVVGRLGAAELAAAGISTDLSYQLCIVLMGFFSVVGVLVSEARGALNRGRIVPELVRGMILSGLLGLAVTLVVLNLGAVLRALGQQPRVIELAGPYYTGFAFAMLPIVWFGVLRSFAAAMMKTGFVLAVTVVTVILNYFLMQGLVHGSFGFPRMGMAGAGIAWALSMWFKFLCLAAYTVFLIRRQRLPLRAGAIGGPRAYGPLVKLGLPVAGIVAMESGLFAATSLLSGIMGTVELAAYQMVMGWIAIPFVISLGISEAAMVRVAYFVGARDPAAARQAGNLGMLVGVGIPLLLVVIPVFAPGLVSRVFLDPGDPDFEKIGALVTTLLLIAAVFQVFDGLQAIASHALRGLKDAVAPLIIAGIGYWLVGLGSGYLLGFHFGWGAPGLWGGVAIGLAFTGTLLAWRFERLAKRQLPE
ncbi:MATE family efflux transporter [Aestuariivirga sp.]|uniref:MATE family efflux transporter n=1 Tax=Aestuariivirga sp. TaxID=2650926 RepID=UPI0025C26C61|nr:MATE family efflux transporter [Aestuariivirga sp.]MCA3555476.1 MATE family efflux transporter [Aestuariivirga sp.]